MTQTQFVTLVYEVVGNYNPEVDEFSTGYQEIINQLNKMKDSALKMELIESTIKEPQLPNFAEARQGQL